MKAKHSILPRYSRWDRCWRIYSIFLHSESFIQANINQVQFLLDWEVTYGWTEGLAAIPGIGTFASAFAFLWHIFDNMHFVLSGYTLMHPSLTRPYLLSEPPLHTDIIHYENIPKFELVRQNILRWGKGEGWGIFSQGHLWVFSTSLWIILILKVYKIVFLLEWPPTLCSLHVTGKVIFF